MEAFRNIRNRVPPLVPSAAKSQDDFQGLSYLVDSINAFGFDLQKAATFTEKKSAMAYSNIYHCFLLLVAGSQGEALAALSKTMGFGSDLDKLFQDFRKLDIYSRSAPGVEMATAASVWHRKSIQLEPKFKSTIVDVFDAHVGPVNADQINDYVAEKTKGKITASYTQGELAPVEVMLMSCLYFKADWKDPFEKSLTVKDYFSRFDSPEAHCNMMHRVKLSKYWEDSDSQICILPFNCGENEYAVEHPRWQAAFILPTAPGKAALESVMTTFAASSEQRNNILTNSFNSYLLDLSLPRFSFEVGFLLNDPLQAIGLGCIFQPSSDFSPLTKSGPLQVSKVTHDVFVQVNEEGAEVAARTVILMTRSRPPPVTRKTMVINRPFVFMIFDAVSKMVLCSVVVDEVEKAE